ncbi:profilin [Nonomuraea insulae]|uniref:Profilin n=1 Tax=Nonomuraea insulae TaxID=1616787 RepID=A0ABW1D815_9ACTN
MPNMQDILDYELMIGPTFHGAAIFNTDGELYAISQPTRFRIAPEEISTVISAYSDPSDVQANGFQVAGHKYDYSPHSDRTLKGRSRDHRPGPDQERAGVICVKSKQVQDDQVIAIGRYRVGINPHAALMEVEDMVDGINQLAWFMPGPL